MTPRLSKDPLDRANELLTRSLPGIRLLPATMPPRVAELVLEARIVRAQTYSEMEDYSDRCRSLAEDMERMGVVIHLVDSEDEDSLVTHMERVEETSGIEEIPARRSR